MSDFVDGSSNSKGDESTQNELQATSSICSTPECGKPAALACPTCIKLNLVPAKFCNQECFTKSWNTHKETHKSAKKIKVLTAMPPEFRNYVFTGKLRPGLLSPPRTVPDFIAKPDYASHPQGISATERLANSNRDIIKVHSKEEIEGIRLACTIGREVLDIAGNAVRPGITCDEIDRIVHEAIIERGAYPSPLNYHNFKKSLCTSVNEVICHGVPDSRELQPGDIVNCDISVYKDGYHSDLNETFFVGDVDEDSRRLVQCAYEALAAAVATVKPGALYRDVGEAIARVAGAAHCTINPTYCGHGVGCDFHVPPTIPHYPKNKAKGTMRAGHIFTIEPMINLGLPGDVTWPDGWTAVTVDGRRSAQFEHTMLVTSTGVELLTARIGEPTDKMVWDPAYFQR